MKIKARKVGLIENWRKAWKFSSVMLTASLTTLAVAYDHIPVMKENMPEDWLKYALPFIIVARIVSVVKLNGEKEEPNDVAETD